MSLKFLHELYTPFKKGHNSKNCEDFSHIVQKKKHTKTNLITDFFFN